MSASNSPLVTSFGSVLSKIVLYGRHFFFPFDVIELSIELSLRLSGLGSILSEVLSGNSDPKTKAAMVSMTKFIHRIIEGVKGDSLNLIEPIPMKRARLMAMVDW